VDFANSVDEAGVSEGKVFIDSHLPVLFASGGHNFFETRVDDINLISTFKLVSLIFESHKLEESGLRLDLIFLGQTAGSDVIEVLQPFEVGAGDTTTVDKHVWGANDSSAEEDLLSGVGGGTIGTFKDSLALNELSVSHMERLLSGSRDHAVSLLGKELLGVLADGLSGVRVADEGTVLGHEVLDFLDVQTGGVVDGRVVLNDSGDLATILLDELGGPVADSTESLDNEGLVLDSEVKTASIDESLGLKHLTDGVVDTETG
jgi:hypothetical protein